MHQILQLLRAVLHHLPRPPQLRRPGQPAGSTLTRAGRGSTPTATRSAKSERTGLRGRRSRKLLCAGSLSASLPGSHTTVVSRQRRSRLRSYSCCSLSRLIGSISRLSDSALILHISSRKYCGVHFRQQLTVTSGVPGNGLLPWRLCTADEESRAELRSLQFYRSRSGSAAASRARMGSRKKVHAFVRVKPTDEFAHEMIKYGDDNKVSVSIDIHLKKDTRRGVVNNQQTDWSFKLDGVLHDASQDLVYETVAKDVVAQALDGYNGTIMCYGQTGAGKTYTMTGATENYKHRGILPRALQQGETNRIIASHTMNKNSSRSHCIFTIYMEAHSRTLSDEKYITSKINLVDLAGSERLGKSGSEGRVLKEATYINKSLSFLEQAIIALGDQKRDHIPFRQCKLTHALKDSLGGNCNMVLVTNIYGEAAQLEETLSSLRFASRMKLVTTEPAINEKYDAERMVKNLEKELTLLKQELAIHDSLTNRTFVTYDPMDEIQIAEINSQVRRYLDGTLDEIDIINLRQIQEVFNQFRVVLSQQEREVESALRRKYTLIDKNDFAAISAVQKAGLVDVDGHLVGEPDGQSFGLGVAPFSTKPGKKSKSKKTLKDQLSTSARKEGAGSPLSGKDLDAASTSKTQLVPSSRDGDVKDVLSRDRETSSIEPLPLDSPKEESRPPRPSTPPPKPVAFEDFKNERGSEINRIFKENKSILNERRKRASETTQRINAIKQEIDVTKEALNFQKSLREKQGEYENKGMMIIDEEEFLLILKLKDLKKQYRSEYQELRDLRAEIQYCQRLVDQCRHRLLMEFDIWYNESFIIPEDMQVALKLGGSIRPGMVPVNRLVSLGEDDQDKFSQLQQMVLPEGPDSISFYNAKVKTEQKHNYLKTMMGLQQTQRK
ncbi:kinesin-like protein KIF9 isoform X3 [Castor canadensis]|uniref:Kinesin-like protein KIF9 isoform X3 n=1 Tax=Castor canadensis TaxID=51338 RepID=A0AC58LFB5_CASCN